MQQIIRNKIHNPKSIKPLLSTWKFHDKKIVFTNGCFDLLHLGHFSYLMEARALGHKLVLGLNSDKSVKRLKGEERPVNDQETRLIALASLHYVDAVIIFEEDTPLELIKVIEPDILVKGGDYKIEDIVGHDIVQAKNGDVVTINFVDGYSSSNLIKKIRTKS